MTENVTGSPISLPSFRDGITFNVYSLNFGGTKAMMKATSGDNIEVVEVMLKETLKREFPNVEDSEINNLEQDDYILLIELITDANKGLNKLNKDEQPEDFTNPAITIA